MEQITYLNEFGDFILRNAQRYAGTYFPLVNEGGMISSVTPCLGGDCKTGQNAYLLAPASSETLHESRASRNFWVIQSGKAPWSVTGQSAPQQAKRFTPEEEETVLTGGLLWQQISRRQPGTGLLAKVLSFVPAGKEAVEIMQVTLENTGEKPLTLTPAAAIPLYGRSADNIRDHRHVTSLLQRVTLCEHGLDLRPTLTFDERGHQKGQLTYRVWGQDDAGTSPEGFVPLVRDFVGFGSYDWPEAVVAPEHVHHLHAGETAQGSEVIASLFFPERTLSPGKMASYQIILTVDANPAPYLTAEGVAAALERTRTFWQSASAWRVRTQSSAFDSWLRWVGIQPLLRRIYGCSFLPYHDYGRGGRGWRDLWQDSLALLLTAPEQTRQDLLRYFAGVRTDGTNATIIGAKPREFKADRNGIPRVWMDHGFWPMLTVELYLNETGDPDFLLEGQPYFRDTLAHRGEGKPLETPGAACEGTVLEHLLIQNVTAFYDVGKHGFMRLRGADWNDGLDMARERGESVAFTAAYAGNFTVLAKRLRDLAKTGRDGVEIPLPLQSLLEMDYRGAQEKPGKLMAYCREMEAPTEKVTVSPEFLACAMERMAQELRENIRNTQWVGDGADLHWFNSYYDNSGRQVEGGTANPVRMMLTGQVFTILSGTATEAQVRQILRSVDWYLWDPSRGGVCLNTDFREVKLDMGRMFGFAYGNKENSAVFCHMAVMYAYALYSRGFAAEGWRMLEQLYSQSADFARSRILPGIPEYFDDRGQGMYPYLTGAGSWLLMTLQCQAFGVRGQDGNLLLEPKLQSCQFGSDGVAEISCTCAGKQLQVRYHNPQSLDWGEYRIEKAVCKNKVWQCGGGSLCIPRQSLPAEDCLMVDVTLVSAASGGTHHV